MTFTVHIKGASGTETFRANLVNESDIIKLTADGLLISNSGHNQSSLLVGFDETDTITFTPSK